MVRVSIDVEAATGVVGALRTAVDDAFDEWTAVANAAGRALCSTGPLGSLSDPLIQISRAATDLETRVELAIVYNTGDDGRMPGGGVLTYELPGDGDSIEAVKQQLGTEIAQGIQGLSPYGDYLNREDVERFEHYTSLLAKYDRDPLVTDALFTELGPEGIVSVPIMLKDFASRYQQGLLGHPEEDIRWGEDTPMSTHIADLQLRFMESFGTGLATSTRSADFARANPDLADEIVSAVTKDATGAGWGLSQVLRHGTYADAFLTDLGTGLYEWEKDQNGPVWSQQLNGDVVSWRLSTQDDGAHYDPFVGLFEAMGRSPGGALDFFNPDGGGEEAQERAEYLIQERTWQADDFNALGEALDAAATGFRSADDPRAEQSAWVASATVHFLATRDGDDKIGDAGKDSLAHLLATYIYDIDRVATGVTEGLGTNDPAAGAPWEVGLPVGANFSDDELRTVMAEVLQDGDAVAHLAGAVTAWNAHRIDVAAGDWGGEGTDSSRVRAALNGSSTLSGYVLSVMGVGLGDVAKSADERAQMFIDLTSDVVGLVPTGGTFTSFLADQALSAGSDAAGDRWTGNESRVADEQHTVREVAYTDLQIAMAVALAEHGHLPWSATTDETGATYAWFDSGRFDADALADPSTRNDFITWMGSGEAGQTATALLPDIAALFDRGVKRGAGE